MTSQKTTNTSSTQTSVLKMDYEYVKKKKIQNLKYKSKEMCTGFLFGFIS